MALTEKRIEAENLYVSKSLSVPAIASALGVDAGTVYRWKAEAGEKGDASDWDTRRRIYNLSPKALAGIYAESVKAWLIRLGDDPDALSDPRIADAMSKHIAALRKIDPNSQYLGAITDLIRFADSWLAGNQPELKAAMEPHWDAVYQAMADYYTKEGLF